VTTPLAALLLAAALGARPATPAPERVVLADGLEIVTWPVAGATRTSLRIVVRAGGASDPADRAGLAHLVEHLALGGSRDEDGRTLLADARRAGAEVNAHTTPDLTKFELDAPAAAFPALAERLVRAVTDPAWELARVERERGIIETEAEFFGREGLLTLVDWALFPAPASGGPLAGTSDSRARLDLADVERFYAARYQPSSMTLIFTGAVRPAEARALVERSFRIPPALPEERTAPAADRPSLPREQKIQGGFTAILLGYALDPQDRGACEAVAALAELRLMLAIQVQGPMVPAVSVGCQRLRGTPLVLAAVFTTRLDAGDLPGATGRIFAELAASPPTATERRAVDQRLSAQARQVAADPARLAERLAAIVAEQGDARPLAARLHPAPLPDPRALARVVARSFAPERRFLVHVTPTEM
jgi:predicted Zn-dependent peptidase